MEAFNYCMEMESNELNSASSDQFADCFFKPSNNWDSSDRFESALSSIVSSPVAGSNSGAGDGVMIRELIGRLGNICNSGGEASASNSCYATPLSSPPKLYLSVPPNLQASMAAPPPILAPLSGDPGFAERAAKNSLFGGGKYEYNAAAAAAAAGPGCRGVRSLANPAASAAENGGDFGDSREGSSVSDQIPINAKKRKSNQRVKAKEVPSLKHEATKDKEENEESEKKSKKESNTEQTKAAAEPPKDYIHVRARRGQATDSHSLAERVRREKISERMKFLQDLVPGCNKVTGKAVMLDEIINYVQSLQRQVEFLSMKLATVNPRMDFNLEALMSKDIFQSRGALPSGMYPLDSSSLTSLPFGYQTQNIHQLQQSPQLHNIINEHNRFQMNPQAMARTPTMHLAVDGFAESAQQVSTLFSDDLQSVVQMGFGPIQQQTFHGSMASGQMKIEL